jgi:hypothetical protein
MYSPLLAAIRRRKADTYGSWIFFSVRKGIYFSVRKNPFSVRKGIDKEQFHVVYPRLRNRPRLGRWVRCKCHVPGRIYGVSRKERRCDPWEIKGLRKREKKDQELLCELP